MAVDRTSIVPHEPRRQRIGTPESLGRNAARTLAVSQGHCWQAMADTHAIGHHAGVGDAVDARGDLIRRTIRANELYARAAIRRGGLGVGAALLDANEGLWVRYAELDQHEDHHRGETGRHAAEAAPHLKASAVDHGALLSASGGR